MMSLNNYVVYITVMVLFYVNYCLQKQNTMAPFMFSLAMCTQVP